MDLQVNIDPKQVEEHLVQSILNSTFGAKVKEALDKSIADLAKGAYYRDGKDVISAAIDRQIIETLQLFILTEYGPLIKEKVKERVTEDFLDLAVNKAWEALTGRLL